MWKNIVIFIYMFKINTIVSNISPKRLEKIAVLVYQKLLLTIVKN